MEITLFAIGLALAYLGGLVVLEIVRRTLKLSAERTRRVAHIYSGLCTILYFQLLPGPWFISLVVVSFLGSVISQRFGLLTAIHDVSRKTYGEVFLPIGNFTTYFISQGDPTVFISSILVLTFADSFAGLISDLAKAKKQTVAASLVFFISAAVILTITSGLNLWLSLLTALIVTLIERYSPLGSDNFTIPVSTALLILLF